MIDLPAAREEIGYSPNSSVFNVGNLSSELLPKSHGVTKAFAYLRVSGKGQVDGDGFPRQLTAIKEHAMAHNLRIKAVYREEGVTGTKESMDRPAWSEMMMALQGNGVRTIVIEKLDRLARDLMVQEATIADLQKHGFVLISVAEPDLMAADPTRILMRQLMGAVAQYDKSQIVAKLRGARMRKRAAEGRCEGRKPFGFYEGESAIIERMASLRASGMAFATIADTLNANGIKPRQGEQWHGFAVNKILTRHSS
jgi:DNA invertase Pin-like site-specific DNA recombinase